MITSLLLERKNEGTDRRRHQERGAAMIEAALVIPLVTAFWFGLSALEAQLTWKNRTLHALSISVDGVSRVDPDKAMGVFRRRIDAINQMVAASPESRYIVGMEAVSIEYQTEEDSGRQLQKITVRTTVRPINNYLFSNYTTEHISTAYTTIPTTRRPESINTAAFTDTTACGDEGFVMGASTGECTVGPYVRPVLLDSRPLTMDPKYLNVGYTTAEFEEVSPIED